MKRNLLILASCLLGLLTSEAIAQPQAPVTWGPIRLLQSDSTLSAVVRVYARGDTIVLHGGHEVDTDHQFAEVCVSGNNGQSWSPWHTFAYAGIAWGYAATFGQTSAGIFCDTYAPGGNAFYPSTNLGQSWSAFRQALPLLGIKDALGDTVVCNAAISSGIYGVTWTADGGQTFAPLREVDMGLFRVADDYAVSDSFVHILTVTRIQPGQGAHVRYSRGLIGGGPLTTPIDLSPNFVNVLTGDIEFDRHGTGVIAADPSFDGGNHPCAVVVYVTHDNGQTWAGPDTLMPRQSADQTLIRVRHWGPLWAIYWGDGTVQPPFVRGGTWYCFSANNARSWYPPRQAFGDNVYGGESYSDVDVRPDQMRIYAALEEWNDVWGKYYFQWEGQIHADTLPPVLAFGEPLPAEVAGGDTVSFRSLASDNDSLWRMDVVLRRQGSPDSTVVPLSERVTAIEHRGSWTVPRDTSQWDYYYRAEDMWEHVAVFPDTGQLSFRLVRDSIPPIILDASRVNNVLPIDSSAEFGVEASDNDTLVQVAAVLFFPSGDSLVLILQHVTGDQYSLLWRVPADTGAWHYHYRVADRWRNQAVYPDSLWSFRVESVSAVSTQSMIPSVTQLTISPNPSNGAVTISGPYHAGSPHSLVVYDLLGREVTRLTVPVSPEGGSYHVSWNLEDPHGQALSTGIYFIRPDVTRPGKAARLSILR